MALLDVLLHLERTSKVPVTQLARKQQLLTVGDLVSGEMRGRLKPTTTLIALVRSLSGVDSLVVLERYLLREFLLAYIALKEFFGGVDPLVDGQTGEVGETRSADIADVVLRLRVHHSVSVNVPLATALERTETAEEFLFQMSDLSEVDSVVVDVQSLPVVKPRRARVTQHVLLPLVPQHVRFEVFFLQEHLSARRAGNVADGLRCVRTLVLNEGRFRLQAPPALPTDQIIGRVGGVCSHMIHIFTHLAKLQTTNRASVLQFGSLCIFLFHNGNV